MADLKGLMEEAAKLADLASAVLPQAAIAGGAVRIGSKLIEVLEDLHPHAPDKATAETIEAAHAKLLDTIRTSSGNLSSRLRG